MSKRGTIDGTGSEMTILTTRLTNKALNAKTRALLNGNLDISFYLVVFIQLL